MSEAQAHPSWLTTLCTVVGCALAYWAFFYLNDVLFRRLEFTPGVNWIFLPSGLRLSLVLIFLGWGALGIALASIAISFWGYESSLLHACITGGISGLAPWVARRLSLDWLKMDPDIQHLHPKQLIQLALIFSITSPVLHQLWFSWSGASTHFLQDTLVMITGDLLGTLFILFGLRLFILALRAQRLRA